MPQFGRLLTAMATPFTPDGQLDLPRAKLLARKLIAEGSDGLVVSGTTGESPTLTRDEKLQLFRSIKEAVGTGAKVIAGTGSYSTAEAISLSQAAEACGVDGLLIVSPYYNKPNQAGLLAHFKAIADATTLPVLLYNHPGRTGVTIEPPTLQELAKHPRIIGVKDSSGSLDLITDTRRLTPKDFLIYSGDDPLTLPILAVGGCGVISVTSHIAGLEIKAMLDAWDGGHFQEALKIHLSLYELSKALFLAPSPAPLKAALAAMGFPIGGVRLPLLELTPAENARLTRVLGSRLAVIS
jgi:4-hydroxy-tetrahydrodipicolinate synthase